MTLRPQRETSGAACGPYVCPFPSPENGQHRAGDRWTCPDCGSRYRLTRPKPKRWWRDWYATHGEWRLTWRQP